MIYTGGHQTSPINLELLKVNRIEFFQSSLRRINLSWFSLNTEHGFQKPQKHKQARHLPIPTMPTQRWSLCIQTNASMCLWDVRKGLDSFRLGHHTHCPKQSCWDLLCQIISSHKVHKMSSTKLKRPKIVFERIDYSKDYKRHKRPKKHIFGYFSPFDQAPPLHRGALPEATLRQRGAGRQVPRATEEEAAA